MRYPQPLAGVLALSTYLPLQSMLEAERHAANSGLPIFVAHGIDDTVISLATGQLTAQALAQHGYDVTYREYPMAHSVCLEEINDIRDFLHKVLA